MVSWFDLFSCASAQSSPVRQVGGRFPHAPADFSQAGRRSRSGQFATDRLSGNRVERLLSLFRMHWDHEPDLHKSLNDEGRMTKEIRSPNVENSQLCSRRFRHSDFVIPSDFVIRHSDLRMTVSPIQQTGQRTGRGGSWKVSTNIRYPTSNIQHRTPKGALPRILFDVRRWMFDVGCSAANQPPTSALASAANGVLR